MGLFDAPRNFDKPKRWKDYSFDIKLMYAYFGTVMVLFLSGQVLTIKAEILIASVAALVVAALSIRHRRELHWEWPGADAKGALAAIVAAIGAVSFQVSTTPEFPPSNPQFFPWYLFGFGVAVVGILVCLRLVEFSEADFLKQCEAGRAIAVQLKAQGLVSPEASAEPAWNRVARGAFYLLFLLVWFAGVVSFYYGSAARHGATPYLTPAHTEPVEEDGKTVYVTRGQKAFMDFLQPVAEIGTP